MRIAITADVHLGFGKGTERFEEPFLALKEFIEKSKECDAIIIAGDLFDLRTPDHDITTQAMELFIPALLAKKDKRIFGIGKDVSKAPEYTLSGIPIILIHGTHERRSRGLVNPIQSLERAGFVLYLDRNGILIDGGKEKVAVQGLSTVPEGWAQSVMQEWGPQPIPGCFNILIFHQTLAGLFPGIPGIDIADIPAGFDLYVCGHIHSRADKVINGKRLLIPGSLVATQLDEDAESKRGFWILETNPFMLKFHAIENQRPIFFAKSEEEIKEILSRGHKMKPLIKVDMPGREKEIQARYGEGALLVFKKQQKEGFAARSLEMQRASVQEIGSKILESSLRDAGLEPEIWEQVFELLLEKRADDVIKLLKQQFKEG
ncbi:MAG: DNA repair exonuclease [Candidatus Aenigmatarchaeota archaeon]